MIDVRLRRIAFAVSAALVGSAALLRSTPAAVREERSAAPVVRLVGKPRRVGSAAYAGVGKLVARRPDGFLLAWGYDSLTVNEHAEDGTLEEVHDLGGLGYAGTAGLRSVEPLGDDAFAATWDVEGHFSGWRYSERTFVQGVEENTLDSERSRAPVLVADGHGGAIGFQSRGPIGFVTRNDRIYFGRWDGTGRLSGEVVAGRGLPCRRCR